MRPTDPTRLSGPTRNPEVPRRKTCRLSSTTGRNLPPGHEQSARLDKLVSRRVITGFGPDLDLPSLGYSVVAFTTLEIAQGRLADVVAHLEEIPEVLEAHAITGPGDLHLRVVARNNEHLQEVINYPQ